jgi:hypothetical protein
LVGKGDSSDSTSTYESTPYVKKDPANFPPPPPTKRYGEGEGPVAPEPRYSASGRPELPSRGDTEEVEKTYEKGPFIPNKSGIDTSKYPEPPGRRGNASPAPQTQARPPPSLPPRLPPRNAGGTVTANEPQASSGFLNQGALNRLGNSGINVAGFGIGSGAKPPPPLPTRTSGSPTSSPTIPPPATGTTWAEKQAAIKTANQLRTNPNAVSLAEIRGAAATAKNFQSRHGDEVASGLQTAQQANQKYGLADRMGQLSVAGKKGPPPPPPAKKFQGALPPPVPVGSKPKPS